MQGFTPGLFDRLDDEREHSSGNRRDLHARLLDECRRSITRDLEALLNTRSALLPSSLAPYPAVEASVVNYGLIDFAGMCVSSNTDQQQICTAVRLAIERHEPRLHKVAVTLRPLKGAINRIEFIISAQLKSTSESEHLSFNAVFRPSLQRYSVEGAN